MSTCLMIYDIPVETGFANPSNELWGYGFRLQFSGWVLMKAYMPHTLIHDMLEAGCKVDTLDLPTYEAGKITRFAMESIKQEIADSLASVDDVCERACQKMQQSGESIGETVDQHRKKVLTTVKKLNRKLETLKKTAERFDVNPDALNLSDAATRIHTLRCNMAERARAYVEAMNEITRVAGERDGMASAARDNIVPPGILADYLDDKGGNEKITRKLRLLTNGGVWFS